MALGQIGDSRAVMPLIVALKDEDLRVREVVAEALVTIYKKGRLGVRDRKAILAQENEIKHLGRKWHKDLPIVCSIPHEDHSHQGFHVDFLL